MASLRDSNKQYGPNTVAGYLTKQISFMRINLQ